MLDRVTAVPSESIPPAESQSAPVLPTRGMWRIRIATVALVAISGVLLWWTFREHLTLESLVQHEQVLREYSETHPLTVYVTTIVGYMLIVAVSLPGASILTPVLGWFFGFWEGVVLASFASAAGATLAFLVSRYLLRSFVEHHFAAWVRRVNAALERDGPFYLLTLRLVPVFPFSVINLVMGLTRMHFWTFWWVSQLGMLPGTCVFVYAGTTIPTLEELAEKSRPLVSWELLAALVALGLLPLILRGLLKLLRREPTSR